MKISNLIGKVKLSLNRHSSGILLVGGILTGLGAIGTAIYSTTKVNKTVEGSVKKINSIREDLKDEDKIANGIIVVKESKKELTKEYAKLALKVTKLYLPSIVLEALSIGTLCTSHKILKTRNIALAAAYATLNNGYEAYRERVKETIGAEAERSIYNGFKKVTKTTEVQKEDGTVEEVTEEVTECTLKPGDNDWAVLFDESNPNWNPNGNVNLEWLMAIWGVLNKRLRSKGYVFLYEVYDALGIDMTNMDKRIVQGSHVVGWLYDESRDDFDNWIDFGICDALGNLNEVGTDMKHGERNCWLDLNPQGDILTGDNNKPVFYNYKKI